MNRQHSQRHRHLALVSMVRHPVARLVLLGALVSTTGRMDAQSARRADAAPLAPSARTAPPDGSLASDSACVTHGITYDVWTAGVAGALRGQIAALESRYRTLARPTAGDSLEYVGTRNAIQSMLDHPRVSRAAYDSAFRSGRFRCRRIRYWSDGLRVAGFIFEPTDTDASGRARRHPVLLYNRGGAKESGALADFYMALSLPILERGYVLVGTQYRGNGGGEGRGEYGGADLHDVVNLAPLVAALPEADTSNVFMLGESRGGMMTYLASKQGMRLNAAAVISGVADLTSLGRAPGFASIYADLIPGYATADASRRDAMLRERSAIAWPESIHTPVLLIHGTADQIVPAEEALALAGALQRAGRRYSLVMYDGDGHGVPANRDDAMRFVFAWFDQHMTRRSSTATVPGVAGAKP